MSFGDGGGMAFLMGCLPIDRESVVGNFSATAGCIGGAGKYPLLLVINLGFEKPGMTGGEGSPLTLSPLLLGGVLNGDTSAASDVASGARFPRAEGSTESDFGGILGFPARFTGGGTGGADDTGRSPFRGSLEGPLPVWVGNTGFASTPGVPLRLGILKNLFPPDADEGESNAA
jgi:hypothetical protein